MKTKKLINRIRAFFDSDLRTSRKNRKALAEVLKQLKRKEKKLTAELALEQDPVKRDKLRLKIELVHSQRKKGVEQLKQAQP